jgi:uncharacterized SAM-binding protein YcdF (DUF218 family)
VSGAVSWRLTVVTAVVVSLVLGWTALAASLLVATDPIGRPDVVFALSGDVLGDRVRRAIDVAAQTDATRLVFFVDGGPIPQTPAEIRERAEAEGVPSEAIRFISDVGSTAMEAGLAAGLVRRCDWDNLAVVTSPYHTRRAGWTFRRTIGDLATVGMVSADDTLDEGGWWRTVSRREVVLGEWAKTVGSAWYLVDPPEPIESDVPC